MIRTRRRLRQAALNALCALALLALNSGCNQNASPTKVNWTLAWQDEFTGPAGQSPDATHWSYDIGTDWGNAQLEYDTARPENVALDGNGNLAITALQESYQGRDYTSGRINTRGHFEQSAGKFEARMKLPRGQGLWPAFWLLGSNIATVPWPGCGEVDIMEYRGQEPSLLHGSLHGPGYSGGNAVTRSYTVPGTTLDGGFHLYAVEWTSSSISWSVDNHVFFSASPRSLPGGATWVFDHPFFVILDLAVGGGFVGSPDANTTFPQQLLVDYVRVYRQS